MYNKILLYLCRTWHNNKTQGNCNLLVVCLTQIYLNIIVESQSHKINNNTISNNTSIIETTKHKFNNLSVSNAINFANDNTA